VTAAKLRARIEAVREARAGIVRTRVAGVPELDRMVAQGIAIVAERALCDGILEDADVLAAVEAIGVLGAERANCAKWRGVLTRPAQRIEDELRHEDARARVADLADRLHAAKGAG